MVGFKDCIAKRDDELNVYYCRECEGILRSPNVRSQCGINRFTRSVLRERIRQKSGESGPPAKLRIAISPQPGTELANMLDRIGIKYTPTCSCRDKARAMDMRGVEWCRKNIDRIVDWLAEEAKERKLPFVRMAGKALVTLAIRRSIKAAAAKRRQVSEADAVN